MQATEPQLTVQVTIPPGTTPGSTLRMEVNGAMVDFVVPAGVQPGQTVQMEVPQIAVATPMMDEDTYVPLPTEYWDITPALSCCVSEKLIMGDQQLVWKQRYPCGVSTKRRPWADLGEIIKIETPCGSSILAPDMMGLPGMEGGQQGQGQGKQQGGWTPGCPCGNQGIVNRIVAVLEDRKAKRGHAAQNQKMDRLLRRVHALRGDLSAAAPASYREQVSIDGLNATMNMTPLPYKEWNILPMTSFLPPW